MSVEEFPANFPQIETKRLILRELSYGDTEALFQNYSDEDISDNFMDAPFTKLAQAKRMIEAFKTEFKQGKAITWAISLKGANTLIGTCSFLIKSSTCVEIGYDLSKTHWGNGLMNESLNAIIEYGFNSLGIMKIKADTLSSNTRSINLLKRLGFTLDKKQNNSHFFSLQK